MDLMTKFWLGILAVIAVAMFALESSITMLLSGEMIPFVIGFIGISLVAMVAKFVLTSSNTVEQLFR